jgi:hypothetical protein
MAASSFADGLTKDQGNAILHELQQIRTLLERQQPRARSR